MLGSLTEKIALVAGGSRGIGWAIAHKLAAAGCDVTVNYYNKRDQAETLCAEIRAMGRHACAIQGNVGNPESVEEILATEVGLKGLREYLSEVPADRFRSPMRVAGIPRLFTPETFCKIVARGLRAGPGDPSRARGSEGTRAPKTDA